MPSIKPLLVAVLLATAGVAAQAEKADRNQPMNIEADALRHDDLKQTSVFTGNVVLTKGTILIRGATPLFWSLQGLIDLSSKFLNLSGNFVVYLISSALLLFLLWHFGQSPKNFTS